MPPRVDGKGGAPGGRHAVVGEKPKNFKQAVIGLTHYAAEHYVGLIVATVLAIIATVLDVVGPSQIAAMTEVIMGGLAPSDSGMDLSAIRRITLFLITIYVVSWVCSFSQNLIMAQITQTISKKMRRQISEKINRLPLKYFDSDSTGNTLSRVTNDVDTIGQTLGQSLGNLVNAGTLFVGSLAAMLLTNWIMTAAGVAATVLGFALMTLIIKSSQSFFTAQQNGLGAIGGHIEETFTGQDVITVFAAEGKEIEEFTTLNDSLYSSAWKSQFLSGMMFPLMTFVGNFGYVVVCVVGAVLTVRGDIGFEVIVAFMLYIRLFTQPVSQFAQIATSLQSAAAAGERVLSFLGEEELTHEDPAQVLDPHDHTIAGEVTFNHVRFGYDPDVPIIKDFSATAKPGHKVAIVGPSGAGKTTLVNLLMRFYEVASGTITIDGIDIRDLSRENVHGLFGMVLQDTWLFEGTIAENIMYAKEGATHDQVVAAAQAVGLHSFIMTLPDGYDTVLTDKSALSQGQRQLVTLARAMVEDAPMLILDEATSSVDTRTEMLVQQAMDRLMAGRTSLVIAHRLSTIRNADLILVLDNGDVVDSGTHDELLARGGAYAELYQAQFTPTEPSERLTDGSQ
ncbi:MAG: ABC transporter ATP-binding protein [Corynebacterium sp.]|nr:ABC transporter ATP-binding protein [Corynebacterium sp.]